MAIMDKKATSSHETIYHEQVYAVVVPFTLGTNGIMTISSKIMCECQAPSYDRCPPYILEILSAPRNLAAARWRHSCASRPWEYDLDIKVNKDGTRDIRAVLTNEIETQIIGLAQGVSQQQFPRIFDKIAQQHLMAHIPVL
ncbi:hypothetical protein D2T29_12260 [Sinirhodobacter populi]|uniref:Uncharacterized protein n=1 Tax=Paenirhodobacter populi TaxID=2306993 RepID=A0A443KC90_9RHOB|nr:hypothetical protein [Sinirhodobacter populi]RWR30439.1 hypothetical protein D2T29_12260 [Sinirhodobacter populi]